MISKSLYANYRKQQYSKNVDLVDPTLDDGSKIEKGA